MNDTLKNEEILSYVRNEVLQALSIFTNHLKYTITLMTTIMAVSLALASFGIKQGSCSNACVIAAAMIMFVNYPVSKYSKKIVYRYYKIYVSNYIHSARIEMSMGVKYRHPWNSDLVKSDFVKDIFDENAVENFIEEKEKNVDRKDKNVERHSWYYYKNLISNFGRLSIATGSILLMYWFVIN